MSIVWHGEKLEIERHAAQIGIQWRLAGWRRQMMLVEWIFRLVYKPHGIPRWDCGHLKGKCLRLVYKPHSVHQQGFSEETTEGWGIIYLGGLLPIHSCDLPGTQMRRAASLSLLDLAPNGGCPAAALLHTPVVSYTTFSPLPRNAGLPRIAGRYISVARSDRLPRPGCYPALRSLEYGLSSMRTGRTAIPRPTWGA